MRTLWGVMLNWGMLVGGQGCVFSLLSPYRWCGSFIPSSVLACLLNFAAVSLFPLLSRWFFGSLGGSPEFLDLVLI